MADEEVEVQAAPPPPSGGGSKLVLILTAVNTLVTVGVLAVVMISFSKSSTSPQVADIDSSVPVHEAGDGKGKTKASEKGAATDGDKKAGMRFSRMLSLDRFTVNLATSSSVNPKYVRVNISLEVPNEDTESEIKQKMPQVRNSIIDLFNSKRPRDLGSGEGREYVKDEIKGALNSFLLTGKVSGVYFTNFAVAG